MPAKPPRTSRTSPARGGRWVLRGLLATGLVLAMLAAGHVLFWFWLGSRLQDGYRVWAAARQAEGWRVEHDPPVRGGWPLAATLTLPRFRLQGGTTPMAGGMDWQADALTLRVALPWPDRLVVDMPGGHHLRLGTLELPFAAARLAAILPIERDGFPGEARLEGERLRIGTAAGALDIRTAWVKAETRGVAAGGGPALAVRAAAGEVGLPPGMLPPGLLAPDSPLDRQLRSLALDLLLTGPVPPGRDPAGMARAWRDGGGSLELRSVGLRWGAAAATATATLTLDQALQPRGAGTLRLTGAAEALAAAAAAGLVTPRFAATARTMVALLARAPPEGGPPRLEVPLSLEDRALTMARIPLLRLPAWTWPMPAGPSGAGGALLPARD